MHRVLHWLLLLLLLLLLTRIFPFSFAYSIHSISFFYIAITVHIIIIPVTALNYALDVRLLQRLLGLHRILHHAPRERRIPPRAKLVHPPNQIGDLPLAPILQNDAEFLLHVPHQIILQFVLAHLGIGRGAVEEREYVRSEVLGLRRAVGPAPRLFDGRAQRRPGAEGGGDSRLEVDVGIIRRRRRGVGDVHGWAGLLDLTKISLIIPLWWARTEK
mmetsp:Transcript_37898/g.91421  ORF Transcript_37898/g.91421 Transcript_37898/m.91421 type:complete len:216 (+) Transcript_37898:399-1046(+)